MSSDKIHLIKIIYQFDVESKLFIESYDEETDFSPSNQTIS